MAIKHLYVYLQGTTCGISMMWFQLQGVNLYVTVRIYVLRDYFRLVDYNTRSPTIYNSNSSCVVIKKKPKRNFYSIDH